VLDARALNQSIDLAFADQGHPRAALDIMGDLRISNVCRIIQQSRTAVEQHP
jgi:hypothetical protein